MKRVLVLLAMGTLVAGCTPAPRSASYFAAHPAEAEDIAAKCQRGQARGLECDHARSGLSAVRDERLLRQYRKAF